MNIKLFKAVRFVLALNSLTILLNINKEEYYVYASKIYNGNSKGYHEYDWQVWVHCERESGEIDMIAGPKSFATLLEAKSYSMKSLEHFL